MLEGVTGKRRVVRLDVEPEILVETVLREEPADGRGVEVVLVLRRLLGLRLNVKVSREAMLLAYSEVIFRRNARLSSSSFMSVLSSVS